MPKNLAIRTNDRGFKATIAEGYSIEVMNPLPEYARVELVEANIIIRVVLVPPNGTVSIPAPGPGKYDVRVTLLSKTKAGDYEELRPAAFALTKHEDVEQKKLSPEKAEVKIRPMSEMFRELEEKEVAAS